MSAWALLAGVAALVPLGSLLVGGGGFLAHPDSELPVRLWAMDTFAEVGVLGGWVQDLGHPDPGPLNNPDPLGTAVMLLLRPWIGQVGAWNTLIVGLLFANLAATYALAMAWLRDRAAALAAAFAVGLMPLLLSYSLASAITDMMNLWPFPLVLLALLRMHRGQAPVRHGALAGLCAGVAVVTSPYATVIAAAGLLPGLLLAGPGLWQELRAPATRGAWLRGLPPLLILSGLIGAAYGLALREILTAPQSQMSVDYLAITRNSPPWEALRPGHASQLIAPLSEVLGIGGLRERDTASHYMRSNAIPLSVLALAIGGALRGGQAARAWAGLALLGVLIAAGPFLAFSPGLSLPGPLNPAFLYAHYLAPGGSLLLETFRYGFLASFAAAMAAAAGVAALRRQGGDAARLATVAPVIILAEVLLVSPAPVPLPVATLEVSPAYARLGGVLAPGALVELPLSDGDTGRFNRIHLLNQRVHRRPIADQVRGSPPHLLLNNDLLRSLVAAESLEDPVGADGSAPKVHHDPREDTRLYRRLRIEAAPGLEPRRGRAELVQAGFAGLVIDPAAYTSKAALQRVLELLGPGTVTVEDRLVHPLIPPPATEG